MLGVEATEADNTRSAEHKPSSFSRLPEALATWVSIITAILSLAISLYTFAITTYEPELLLIMPNQVRIVQGGTSGPLIYIQPMFISTGLSERVEVITSIRVQIAPVNQTLNPVEFVWDEQGTWIVDPVTQNFDWAFTGDSGPFLVSAKNAQFFTGLFIGPSNWLFEPGRYQITLIANRITNSQPLRTSVDLFLAEEDVAYLNQSQGTRFLAFPVIE
jgi:hypothetical protein